MKRFLGIRGGIGKREGSGGEFEIGGEFSSSVKSLSEILDWVFQLQIRGSGSLGFFGGGGGASKGLFNIGS